MNGPIVEFTEEALDIWRRHNGVEEQRWRIYSTVDGVPREPYDEWRQVDYPVDGPRHTPKGRH